MFLFAPERYLAEKTLAPFFEKGYGITLLGHLYRATCEAAEIGTYDIYLQIPDPKPQYPAFRDFLARLRRLNLVTLIVSTEKKTRKLPRLEAEVIACIERVEKELFEQTLVDRATDSRQRRKP